MRTYTTLNPSYLTGATCKRLASGNLTVCHSNHSSHGHGHLQITHVRHVRCRSMKVAMWSHIVRKTCDLWPPSWRSVGMTGCPCNKHRRKTSMPGPGNGDGALNEASGITWAKPKKDKRIYNHDKIKAWLRGKSQLMDVNGWSWRNGGNLNIHQNGPERENLLKCC